MHLSSAFFNGGRCLQLFFAKCEEVRGKFLSTSEVNDGVFWFLLFKKCAGLE